MAEGQVRAVFEPVRTFPHPSAAKNAALCPLPGGEGTLEEIIIRGMRDFRIRFGATSLVSASVTA
jgi:hypothetical protein